jgi:hypothetical protein
MFWVSLNLRKKIRKTYRMLVKHSPDFLKWISPVSIYGIVHYQILGIFWDAGAFPFDTNSSP